MGPNDVRKFTFIYLRRWVFVAFYKLIKGWMKEYNLGQKNYMILKCYCYNNFMSIFLWNIEWYNIKFLSLYLFNCYSIRLFIQLIGIMRADSSCAAIQMVAWLCGTWKTQAVLSRSQFHMVRCMLSKGINYRIIVHWFKEVISMCLVERSNRT